MFTEWNTKCIARYRAFHHIQTFFEHKSVVANWIQIYQIQTEWNLQIIKRGQPFDLHTTHTYIYTCTLEKWSIQQMFCKNKHLFRELEQQSRALFIVEIINVIYSVVGMMFNSIPLLWVFLLFLFICNNNIQQTTCIWWMLSFQSVLRKEVGERDGEQRVKMINVGIA